MTLVILLNVDISGSMWWLPKTKLKNKLSKLIGELEISQATNVGITNRRWRGTMRLDENHKSGDDSLLLALDGGRVQLNHLFRHSCNGGGHILDKEGSWWVRSWMQLGERNNIPQATKVGGYRLANQWIRTYVIPLKHNSGLILSDKWCDIS